MSLPVSWAWLGLDPGYGLRSGLFHKARRWPGHLLLRAVAEIQHEEVEEHNVFYIENLGSLSLLFISQGPKQVSQATAISLRQR